MQNTSVSEQVGKVRLRKNVRRCGAKRISKSKCTKHTMFGPLLDIQMSFRVAGMRIAHPVKNKQNLTVYGNFNCNTTTSTTLQYTPFCSTTLQYTAPQLHYYTTLITLHYITLHYTPLHYITLHSITLHYKALQLRYITQHYN